MEIEVQVPVTPVLFPEKPELPGFRYFWMKRVRGFRPKVHCAACLLGEYERQVGVGMQLNETLRLQYSKGDVLYLCGVAKPYIWKRNFHLALQVGDGELEAELWNGGVVKIKGAARIEFGPEAAEQQFPELGRKFLTCRNFQFGAQHFGPSADG
jgi:hypothetical protein